MHRHRHAADVPAIADREQREQPDQRVLGRVHRAEHLVRLDSRRDELGIGQRVPARPRRQRAGREVERNDLDRRVGRRPLALEREDGVRHVDRAEVRPAGSARHPLVLARDRDVGVFAGLGVLVGVVGRFEPREVVVEIEPLDPPLPALVQVQRAGMRDVEHPAGVDRPDEALLAVVVPPTSRNSTDEPVRSPTRGRAARAPPSTCDRPRGLSCSSSTSSRTASSRPGPNHASSLGSSGSSCAAHATCGRSTNGFDGFTTAASGVRPKSSVGCAGVPLVELVVAGDEHRRGPAPRPSGAAGLLAHRRERAGEAVEHDRVEPADVDAELERVGRRDAEQAAVAEPAFELAALLGEVAGAVRGDPAGHVGIVRPGAGAAPARRRAPRRAGCA